MTIIDKINVIGSGSGILTFAIYDIISNIS